MNAKYLLKYIYSFLEKRTQLFIKVVNVYSDDVCVKQNYCNKYANFLDNIMN